MSNKQPSDSAVRAAAVDPARSFIIQAPAGSGKTELLTDRILALLATVNRPEEIVAITFTRKAASEMHARVIGKLEAGKGPEPGEPHKRRSWLLAQRAMRRNEELGWSLLEHPARLSIRTIDSFCTYLVRAMPWLSSLGGVPAIADNAREHYEAAARATLAMADEHAAVAALIEHMDVDVGAAQSLLADMLASRDQWLPLLAEGGDIDLLMDNLNRSIEQDLRRLKDAMPPGWAQALAEPIREAARCLAESEDGGLDLSRLLDWDGAPFGTDAQSLGRWQALADILLTGKGTPRRTATIKQGFKAKSGYKEAFLDWIKAVPEEEPWVAELADIRCAPARGYSAGQQEVLAVLIQVLWLAAAQLKLRFTETGEVDFAEISQRALQALGEADDPSDLLLALDASIRHLLVDEFQDTSQSQIALLERLTAGWSAGDGRTLFLVGDPMQSIYRFRKADVGGFLRVKENGLGEVELTALDLTDNFRSQAHLVEWVNAACGPIFPSRNHPGLGAITYTPSAAFNEGRDGPGAEFHPVWLPAPADGDAAEDLSDDAEALAVRLAREALERNAGSEHPVAILVRARTHLGGIVHRLAEQGVPCRAVELVTLRSRQPVIDLAQLARALSHPADRLAWLSVLRSPLCGLTLNSLHALCGHDHHAAMPALIEDFLKRAAAGQAGLPAGELKRLRHAAHVMLDPANAAGAIPFAAWLEECWTRLGGPAVYPEPSDRADVERLFRLVEELAPYGNLDPVELENRLDELYAAPSGGGPAVEVMTIHKSKGLEFETVIIAGLHKSPRSDRAPLMRFEQSGEELLLGPIKPRAADEHDPVSLYLAAREKKRAAYEADRLLYVALTRARKQLHLIGELRLDEGMAVKPPSGASMLGRLWGRMRPPEAPEAAALQAAGATRKSRTEDRRLLRMAEASIPASREARPLAGGPPAPWDWRAATTDESIIGSVAHAWLERLGHDGAEAWSEDVLRASLPVFRKQLSRAGLRESRLDAAAGVLRDTLLATLASERGRWLLHVAKAHREWALLDVSGRVSVIDLAISRERDWLVVDYKTGVPRDGESAAEFSARMKEAYREQIERYCAHVRALDGRPARGALYFPRADIWVDYGLVV
ncbi:MAG: UvrD-helicase domain-containing protein [Alcaligenaceae bacterium]|nr:UvrD-helicase domain-containing protein [Alcaligenaceae bacterium]